MTLRRFLSAEDGSALVEVALALPLLAMVLGRYGGFCFVRGTQDAGD